MSVHLFQVGLLPESGLPADIISNAWNFDHFGPPTDYDNVRDMLADFYGEFEGYLAGTYLQPIVGVRAYDLADPKPRVPKYESIFELPAMSAAEALPHEVALCASFHSAYVSGEPAARFRNRKYLGPFTENGSSEGRPATGLIDAVVTAMENLAAASAASATWTWVQHSDTDNESRPVVGGWVDNAWDTQRRRGVGSTLRSLWSGTS